MIFVVDCVVLHRSDVRPDLCYLGLHYCTLHRYINIAQQFAARQHCLGVRLYKGLHLSVIDSLTASLDYSVHYSLSTIRFWPSAANFQRIH